MEHSSLRTLCRSCRPFAGILVGEILKMDIRSESLVQQHPIDGLNKNTLPLTPPIHRVGPFTGPARFFTHQNKQMTYTKAIPRLLWNQEVHYHLHNSLPPVVTLSIRQGHVTNIITINLQVLLSVASFLSACMPYL
jgi:hypothetical protein